MSVVVCRSSAAPFHFENEGVGAMVMPNASRASIPSSECRAPARQPSLEINKVAEERPGTLDIWSMIQSQKTSATAPYVHPLVRRSLSLMSQKSLEMCTENLGSESGYDDFSSDLSSISSETDQDEEEVFAQEIPVQQSGERPAGNGRRELSSVNYHCSVRRRSSPPRSFPPPLPSISRRDGPCFHMRPHRIDGRLVMEAVAVPSQNYLHARRQDGRLLLSFIDTSFHQPDNVDEMPPQPPEVEPLEEEEEEEEEEASTPTAEEEEYGDEEEEEEEEVEVVDRGTVVEVKVSTQPQQQSGAMRVHRSSLVINKFVGGMPLTNQNRWLTEPQPQPTAAAAAALLSEEEDTAPPRRPVPTTTTAAAAAVAASSMSAASEVAGYQPPPPDNKLLFTSKRRNREEMLHHMRRCSQLRRPLFFWEPCCIATSS